MSNQVPLIIFPLIGSIFLLLFLTLFCIFRRKIHPTRTEPICEKGAVLSALDFDGKIFYEEIVEATQDFNKMYRIGKGGSGDVYKVRLRSGAVVAVKKLRLHQMSESGQIHRKEFLNEYLKRGSLSRILRNEAKARRLDWHRRVNIIVGVAHALCYMHHDHRPPVVHRDISSNNVLLDSKYVAHVSDFGTAKLLDLGTTNWSAVVGTYGYVAPELAYTMKVTEKCDVYSFGVLAIEVIKGKHPGETIPSLAAIPLEEIPLVLKKTLDSRLPVPSPDAENKLLTIFKLAIASTSENPHQRPTMKLISRVLSGHSIASLGIQCAQRRQSNDLHQCVASSDLRINIQ